MPRYTRIGIVVPTMPELMPLLAMLKEWTGQEATIVERSIWRIYHVQSGEMLISLIQSGPGMVNAAAATEALICYEQPQAILNYGIAGAHIEEAFPGDIIIATQVCAPFNGYLEKDGRLNSAFGIRWDDEAAEAYYNRKTQRFSHLACDAELTELAVQAAYEFARGDVYSIVAPPGEPVRPIRILQGVIASADTYCRHKDTFAYIRTTFQSLGEDMESAAVGQTAVRHRVPFAIVRCLSNNDMLEVLTLERKKTIYPEMARRAAAVVFQCLEFLASSLLIG